VNEVHAGFWIKVEWLRKYRLKIAIGIAIDSGIEGGRRDSDSDLDSEYDKERFSTLIRVEPFFQKGGRAGMWRQEVCFVYGLQGNWG